MDKEKPVCSVCLGIMGKRRRLKLDCHHEFHYKCIFRWIKNNNNCPLCRTNVIKLGEDDIHFFFHMREVLEDILQNNFT